MHNKWLIIIMSFLWVSGCSLFEENPGSGVHQSTVSAVGHDYLMTPVPKSLQQQFEKALKFVESGHKQQALALFKQLHEQFSQFSGAAVNIAILLEDDTHVSQAQQRAQQAERVHYLEAALQRQQTNYFALNRLGVIKRQQYKLKEAEALFTKAVTINKKYALAWYNLGILNEIYLGDPQAAIVAYTAYLDVMSPQVPEHQARIQKRISRLSKK